MPAKEKNKRSKKSIRDLEEREERVAQIEKRLETKGFLWLALMCSALVLHFAANHFLSPGPATAAPFTAVLVWVFGTTWVIYRYEPKQGSTAVEIGKDYKMGEGDQGAKDPKRQRTSERTNEGITQSQCDVAHLSMDRQRVESAKSVFAGQSDKFGANPHVLPGLITELGATTTIVHSFGVHAEDHNSNHNMRVVKAFFNPKNGKATPINLVNFCPEKSTSTAGPLAFNLGQWGDNIKTR
jgi:hypothetical protein